MRIETGSRLHFGLIDLSSESNRVDGGIGLGIESPGVILEVKESDDLRVRGPMRERVKDAAGAVIRRYDLQPVEIRIKETIPQHQGLGSGTQTDLAAGFAVARTNNLELSSSEVAKTVGRGGTSGIGTAVFENGGFVLDGGHDLDEKGGFLPSAASSVSPPPVISRLDFPDWHINILIPDSTGAYGSDEVSVFKDECPIPSSEVKKLSYTILMKLLPSIVESDFNLFKDSIEKIQEIGFKKRELQRQPDSLSIIRELQNKGYAVGMSSLGPAVFVISPDPISMPYNEIKTIETKAMNQGVKFS